MDGIVIDEALIEALWAKARSSERLRQNFDLRTTPADTSQRMLNALMPGTQVPIHRHEETTETVAVTPEGITTTSPALGTRFSK